MQNRLTLIKTEYYADVFPALIKSLKNKVNFIEGKNLVFCEEKASLMVESAICSNSKGTFNTDVYSFGKYLKKFAPNFNAVSKEGSCMAVKYVLSKSDLGVLSASKTSLAPSLYELITQLKSAKVTAEDLENASFSISGMLKNKIKDVATVFAGYERFLAEKDLKDQSSFLSFLPVILENDQTLKDTDVYLVGYSSWTRQARSIVEVLLKKARSVTAILTGGSSSVYINETTTAFLEIAKSLNETVNEFKYKYSPITESELVLKELFKPFAEKENVATEKVKIVSPDNCYKEIEFVAEQIKDKVINGGLRYLDFTVCANSLEEYSEVLSQVFSRLDIPFFIDEKKNAIDHPLVKLIISYLTAKEKNMEREAVLSFVKNPIILDDKEAGDRFEEYVYKYNVNYSRFNAPFIFGEDNEKAEAEEIRKNLCNYFEDFSIKNLIKKAKAEEKLSKFKLDLTRLDAKIESAVNEQIYSLIVKLLDDMDFILRGESLNVKEIKELFLSGVSAMELSVIPQFKDAVFVGLYKNTSLIRAKYLFAIGLDSSVPSVKDDVALLSDADINKLSDKGVLIEPKIRHVNKRAKEETAQALSAFTNGLILSCPTVSLSGERVEKSRILNIAEKVFGSAKDTKIDGYYTLNQGLLTYAENCSDYVDGEKDDFTVPASFYTTAKNYLDFSAIERATNREVKICLDGNKEIIAFGETSPTTIEEFYSCPYRTFLSKGLNLEVRKEGKVDHLFVGVLEHGVLDEYVKRVFIDKTEIVIDKSQSDELVDKIVAKIMERDDLAHLLEDEISEFKLANAVNEVKESCFIVKTDIDRSNFKPFKTEVGFGLKTDGENFPAISLLNGKIKLVGKIDRIDKFNDYFRIIDYKTGTPTIEEKKLFTGNKLQLYLYSLALNGKKVAGVYYQPVNESFYSGEKALKGTLVGRTLADIETLNAQDSSFLNGGKSDLIPVTVKGDQIIGADTEEELSAYIDYAKRLCEKAAEQIADGVIIASPSEKACSYCPYSAVCDGILFERKVKEVDKSVIIDSVRGKRDE